LVLEMSIESIVSMLWYRICTEIAPNDEKESPSRPAYWNW
jgi:hypothetical protein